VDKLKAPGKPFVISKRAVQVAWGKVRANGGAAGADGVSIEEFESDLKNNLYKIWNRMSSGTYFPPPVKAVEIPKAHGTGTRMLGVSTVADRVAQTVVAGVPGRGPSRSSTRTPAATVRAARRWMRSGPAGSGAGDTTGWSSLTSASSSAACRGT